MHPSTAQARVIVDELVRCGLRHLVVCPGSRNAPLSMAAYAAAAAGRLTLHVRIDERSAGFLALGLAKAASAPVAVTCTSGTAVANLHPAVLEAHHSGTPLLLLTADRPPELLGTGANQTISQFGIFGPAALAVAMPLAERRTGANAVWRGMVCRAMAATAHGPVQLNVPLREPLVPDITPDADADWPEETAGRPDGEPWTRSTPARRPMSNTSERRLAPRGVLVVGDPGARSARVWEAAHLTRGWPVIAEPTGTAPALLGMGEVLRTGSLLLNCGELPPELRPDEVVVVGRPTLSRGVGALLRAARRVLVVDDRPEWTDAQHLAALVTPALDPDSRPTPDPDWLAAWRAADRAAEAVLEDALGPTPRAGGTGPDLADGPTVARELVSALPPDALLFVGSSNPIRFVDLFARPRADLRIVANRGVAGIDGSVSTAAGLALGYGRATYALLGDLTFLHDINGLLIGPDEPRPDLTVVVLNDDGGGIFTLLEQGAPEHAASFERVFGTPHGANLAALCAGYGVPHLPVTDVDKLRAALAPAAGPRVVEIRIDRGGLRDAQAAIKHAVRAAVGVAVARP